MKYFRDILQTITYDSSEVINIFKKLNIDSVLNDEYLIDYVIQDGMTPEKISHELYDDVDLWWTIMIINNKFDRFYDFPLPDSVLTEYIDYLIDIGDVTLGDTTTINAIKTTNDANRYIKVIDPKYIRKFLYTVEQLINL